MSSIHNSHSVAWDVLHEAFSSKCIWSWEYSEDSLSGTPFWLIHCLIYIVIPFISCALYVNKVSGAIKLILWIQETHIVTMIGSSLYIVEGKIVKEKKMRRDLATKSCTRPVVLQNPMIGAYFLVYKNVQTSAQYKYAVWSTMIKLKIKKVKRCSWSVSAHGKELLSNEGLTL